MKSLGYQPNVFARGLASGRSMAVGVITQQIGTPVYSMIIQGLIHGFGGTGYSPLIADGQWKEGTELDAIQSVVDRHVDGLVLIGAGISLPELNSLRTQLPTIVVAKQIPGWSDQCVYVDNRAAAYDATRHLIDFGHRKIAMICGIKHHPDAINRLEGYSMALAEAGIELDPLLIQEGDFTAQSGLIGVNGLLARGRPFTAVFCANDMMAFGARLALQRHGIRVPDDVSIVGFDDQAESSYVSPPLTTVRQPGVEMGELAARTLLKMIQGEPCKVPILHGELQYRESVARVR
jgi:LacI family transcriptional regulator